jgi:hypothetical protein
MEGCGASASEGVISDKLECCGLDVTLLGMEDGLTPFTQ